MRIFTSTKSWNSFFPSSFKKLKTNYLSALRLVILFILALNCNVLFAETAYKILSFPDDNNANNSVSSYTDSWTAIKDGFSWTISNFNNNQWKNSWTYIKCGSTKNASVAFISTTSSIDKSVSSVVVTIDKVTASSVNSIYLVVASDADFASEVETVTATSIVTGDLTFPISEKKQKEGCFYKLVFDCAKASKKNGVVQVSKVVYNTNEGIEPTSCAAPVFNPTDGTRFNESLVVTATTSTDGAKVVYNTDNGSTFTDFPTDGLNITSTTTVYAKAVDESGTLQESAVVSATYEKAEALANLAELKEKITSETSQTYFVKLNNAVVTKVSGNKASIEENAVGILFYGSNSFKAGDTFTGTAQVTGVLYQGYQEITSFSGVEPVSGTAPDPTVITIDDLNNDFATYGLRYVKIEKANATTAITSDNQNGAISDGESSLTVHRGNTNITMSSDVVVDVQGIAVLYKGTTQLMVYEQDDITEYEPINISSTGYASLYYGTKNLVVPKEVSGWTYAYDEANAKLVATESYESGCVIPAGTAVVLYTKTAPATYYFAITNENGTAVDDNALMGSDEAKEVTVSSADKALYMLSNGSKGIGFYRVSSDGQSFTNGAHRAYLELPVQTSAKFFSVEGGTDEITKVNSDDLNEDHIYTIQGQKLASIGMPGLYIVNGKKLIVK